jgi:hypothetical protein
LFDDPPIGLSTVHLFDDPLASVSLDVSPFSTPLLSSPPARYPRVGLPAAPSTVRRLPVLDSG